MRKPEDIPQDVWDHAEVLAKEATRDAMRDPLMPYFVTVRPYIARAILSAKAEERDEIAATADRWAVRFRNGAEAVNSESALVGLNAMTDFAAAIRKRGEE